MWHFLICWLWLCIWLLSVCAVHRVCVFTQLLLLSLSSITGFVRCSPFASRAISFLIVSFLSFRMSCPGLNFLRRWKSSRRSWARGERRRMTGSASTTRWRHRMWAEFLRVPIFGVAFVVPRLHGNPGGVIYSQSFLFCFFDVCRVSRYSVCFFTILRAWLLLLMMMMLLL